MRPRPSLKGKGVDIFLGEPEAKKEAKKGKATFYFPENLLSELDEAWFVFRRINRKIKKSDIVQASLEIALKEFKEKEQQSPLMEYFKEKK
ncbi:MAG: hypothetical protein NC831_08095 [Candidatus Omnitrophica bacterium]|nr:hypothetical protein [Candidatus Omnitrophota bacterium]MCM8828525.1 hypothetical protein [Candidatus Omnitrophota bacterium]